MASVSWVMSAAAPARSGLINPAGLPGPEIQEEPLLAGYVEKSRGKLQKVAKNFILGG